MGTVSTPFFEVTTESCEVRAGDSKWIVDLR